MKVLLLPLEYGIYNLDRKESLVKKFIAVCRVLYIYYMVWYNTVEPYPYIHILVREVGG